jgi:hypothetical protein
LLFHLSKDRGTIESTADHRVPVPAVFAQYFLIPVADQLLIGIALGNEQYKLTEEYVVFVDFF